MTIKYISTGGEISNKVDLKSPPESEKITTKEGKKIVRLLPKIENRISLLEKALSDSRCFEDSNAIDLILGLLKNVQKKLESIKFLLSPEECRAKIDNLLEDVLAEGIELKKIEPNDMVPVILGVPLRLSRNDDEKRLARSFDLYLKPYFSFLTSELRKLLL
jgi:hypothetical protein